MYPDLLGKCLAQCNGHREDRGGIRDRFTGLRIVQLKLEHIRPRLNA